ncbi:hypothetical protein [Chengkuizengella marina]|uniref:Uncharacterized protein n=1 Tax=Chengkuizengella marina TaxID=2507566 RepID=A0A6N9PYN8_9BACL|nr:hypothetical protein [Chengkuizengella marina]NBI28629.1 hypothetical protein [Chengkuizengella marina]
MKYTINLFGHNTDCILSIEDGKLELKIPDEHQKTIESYLSRVLTNYDSSGISKKDLDLEAMVKKAIEIEHNLGSHMKEPKLKLPYELKPEVKEKLIESASIQDISATQLLIKMIESKYQEVMNN